MNETRRVARVFDRHGESYSETVNRSIAFSGLSVDFFTRVKAAYLLDLVETKLADPRTLSMLDVGCGVGNFHQLLEPRVGELYGVDVSAASIEIARNNNPNVSYRTYDGFRLPYDSGSCDVAFAVCVMHHVPTTQWPLFVAELKRVLKSGGLAVVFEHNPKNPLAVYVVNRCPFDEDAVLLSQDETNALFRNAGFTNISSRSILTVPAANRWLRKVDQVFGRLPMGAQYYLVATNP